MLKTMSEVKETGWNALVERLGVAGATLFVLEYEKGYGDYMDYVTDTHSIVWYFYRRPTSEQEGIGGI